MVINVVSLFPEFMEATTRVGILDRARRNRVVGYRFLSPRDFAKDKHGTVDDSPYGGQPGMIMMAQPMVEAVEKIQAESEHPGHPVIMLSPRGRPYDQKAAKRLSREAEITLLCGRYKGMDERIRDLVVTEEISLGDFILTGGELAAAIVIDSVVRLLPDVMTDLESAETDSFGADKDGGLDWPHYTRPMEYQGLKVPGVLLSGDHAKIKQWREEQSRRLTQEQRPDLFTNAGPESPEGPGR
jgi:tRNA (guanine37-N1)-methyltransferase